MTDLLVGDVGIGARFYDKGGAVYNVQHPDFGAMGDGSTADDDALADSIAAWLSDTNKATLLLPAGRYRLTENLLLRFAANESTAHKRIVGYGAELYCDFSSGYGMTIDRSGSVNVRHLTIEGLTFRGRGSTDTLSGLLKIDGGDNSGFIHRFDLLHVAFEAFMGDGLLITGNAFECQLLNCNAQAETANTAGACFHFTSPGTGLVSSVDIVGCTTDRGKHGVFAETPMIGARVFGGTFIQAQQHGIRLGNAREGWCIGAHVENNWQGGSASPGWGTTQAGIQIEGYGGAIGCYATDSTGKQRYGVRAYASPLVTVIGGCADGNIEYYLRADGPAGGRVTAIGIPKGDAGCVHDGMPSDGTLIKLGAELEGAMDFSKSYLEGQAISDPAAPASGRGRIYFRDFGMGRTELVCKFSSGAVQQIALQP